MFTIRGAQPPARRVVATPALVVHTFRVWPPGLPCQPKPGSPRLANDIPRGTLVASARCLGVSGKPGTPALIGLRRVLLRPHPSTISMPTPHATQ
jgi:hypothetical protein